jgi:hypothetical protein
LSAVLLVPSHDATYATTCGSEAAATESAVERRRERIMGKSRIVILWSLIDEAHIKKVEESTGF